MSRASVKKSMLEQLALKGLDTDFHKDFVNDYMSLWDTKDGLQKDIKSRGVVYKDFSSVGVEMFKNNPSVKDFIATNKQMMQILKDLGLNVAAPPANDGSDLI